MSLLFIWPSFKINAMFNKLAMDRNAPDQYVKDRKYTGV